MDRVVKPEILDSLPPTDPRMAPTRRDLVRINWWMGNHRLMARALKQRFNGQAPRQLLELGAGDGTFLLQIAARTGWRNVDATLLDRQQIVGDRTLAAFTRAGWTTRTLTTDVLDWPRSCRADAIIANLFLHHFQDPELAGLLQDIARSTDYFVAIEPRRFRFPSLFWPAFLAIGCHPVTRHDAVASIRAGFRRHELTRLWPDQRHWRLSEQRAGWFSHLFIAEKIS
ncbi:MAG TPA: methyltransferase domain-containing protein [Verrucomicrobiae bacterium]|nr:methyltransferase domain-containing protein [Verrucomicrobiae bacterium]